MSEDQFKVWSVEAFGRWRYEALATLRDQLRNSSTRGCCTFDLSEPGRPPIPIVLDEMPIGLRLQMKSIITAWLDQEMHELATVLELPTSPADRERITTAEFDQMGHTAGLRRMWSIAVWCYAAASATADVDSSFAERNERGGKLAMCYAYMTQAARALAGKLPKTRKTTPPE